MYESYSKWKLKRNALYVTSKTWTSKEKAGLQEITSARKLGMNGFYPGFTSRDILKIVSTVSDLCPYLKVQMQ